MSTSSKVLEELEMGHKHKQVIYSMIFFTKVSSVVVKTTLTVTRVSRPSQDQEHDRARPEEVNTLTKIQYTVIDNREP